MEKLTKDQAVKEWIKIFDWCIEKTKETGKLYTPREYQMEFNKPYKNPLCRYVKDTYGEIDCKQCPGHWQHFVPQHNYYYGPVEDCKDHNSQYDEIFKLSLYDLNNPIKNGNGDGDNWRHLNLLTACRDAVKQ